MSMFQADDMDELQRMGFVGPDNSNRPCCDCKYCAEVVAGGNWYPVCVRKYVLDHREEIVEIGGEGTCEFWEEA